jgi:carbonic anhydrase/acetyltransferase-like protein (isoleucine patch superfamily)
MAIILEYKGKKPKIGKNVFLAENAVVIGDVEIGNNANIWYGCVIRADVNYIRIGENTNVQDGSVIHVGSKDGPTIIGNNVTIGHMCLLHACHISNNAFIGMHSTILDYAKIGEYSLIGAKSLVTMNKNIPDFEMWYGNPIKKQKDIDDDLKKMIDERWGEYVKLAGEYLNSVNKNTQL